MRDKVFAELDRLVEIGVLSPVSHSEWTNPIVLMLKRQLPVCGDFVDRQPGVFMEQYPIPVTEDLFATLNRGDCFSALDLQDAYNQVVLDEDSKKLTATNTRRGLFSFTRLPLVWHLHLLLFSGKWRPCYKTFLECKLTWMMSS